MKILGNYPPSLAQGDQLSEEECDKISQNLANLSNANRSLNSILGTFSEKFSHSQWLSGAGHLAGMISAPISGATAGYKLVFHAGLKRFRKFGAEITLAVRNDLVADSTRAMVGGVAVAGGTSVANTGIVKIGEHFEVPLILSVGD